MDRPMYTKVYRRCAHSRPSTVTMEAIGSLGRFPTGPQGRRSWPALPSTAELYQANEEGDECNFQRKQSDLAGKNPKQKETSLTISGACVPTSSVGISHPPRLLCQMTEIEGLDGISTVTRPRPRQQ